MRSGGSGRLGIKANAVNPLANATWAIDATASVVGEQYADNMNRNYPGMFAKYGSAVGAQIIRGALHLPGVAGNYASIPDAANLTPTTSLDARISFSTVAKINATPQCLFGQYDVTNNRAWFIGLEAVAGNINFSVSSDGITPFGAFPAVTFPEVSGEITSVRCTWDNAGNMSFYCKKSQKDSAYLELLSDTNWTFLTTITGGPTTMFNSSAGINIGALINNTGYMLNGTVYAATIRVDETLRVGIDFSKALDLATSFTCETGQTVTVTSSTTGVDTNDPTFLPWKGQNYIYGSTITELATVPNQPAFVSLVGDIEVIQLLSTTSTANSNTCGRFAVGDHSFTIGIGAGRFPRISISTDGTAVTTHVCSASIAADTDTWIKTTRRASDGLIQFFTSPSTGSFVEPSNWTQLGSDITGATGNLFTPIGASVFRVFGLSGSSSVGRYYRTIVRNGIGNGATTVLDASTASLLGNATSFVCATGQTVNLPRATAGLKTVIVTRPCWLFGTDDFMEVANNALLDSDTSENLTVLIVGRKWDNSGGAAGIMLTKGPAGPGWQLRDAGGSPFLGKAIQTIEGANNISHFTNPTPTNGQYKVWAVILDKTNNLLISYNSNSAASTALTGSPNTHKNAQSMFIGATSTTTGFWDGEMYAAAIFRRVLTAAEIAAIVNYYQAS